jgi:Protoporphyrinogen oxidase
VLESDDAVGGRMSSVVQDGFTMNRAANILPASYATIRQLAEDVGLGDQISRMDGAIGTLKDGRVRRLRSDHLVVDALRTDLLRGEASCAPSASSSTPCGCARR